MYVRHHVTGTENRSPIVCAVPNVRASRRRASSYPPIMQYIYIYAYKIIVYAHHRRRHAE
jgi:hypothetical protein